VPTTAVSGSLLSKIAYFDGYSVIFPIDAVMKPAPGF